jgi:hypothetical protein
MEVGAIRHRRCEARQVRGEACVWSAIAAASGHVHVKALSSADSGQENRLEPFSLKDKSQVRLALDKKKLALLPFLATNGVVANQRGMRGAFV